MQKIKPLFKKSTRQKVTSYFEGQIATDARIVRTFEEEYFGGDEPTREQREKLLKSSIPTFLLCAFYYHSLNTDTLLNNLYSVAFTLDDRIASQLTKIEKEIQTISEQTGADLSTVKKEVADLKQTVIPTVKSVVQLFDNLTEAEKKREKNGRSMIV